MFNGVQDVTIDTKGRLAVPAKFREPLSHCASNVLCTTLKERTHLLLYPERNWSGISEQLMNLPTTGNRVLQRFQQLVLGNMERLEPDSAGRILLPQRLRSLVEFGQEKEVVMVGRADRLEIWSRSRWDEQTAEILDMDPELLEIELAKTDLRI